MEAHAEGKFADRKPPTTSILVELRRRQSLLRDRVRGVGLPASIRGLYLAGPAGVGKTHLVLDTLRQMGPVIPTIEVT